MIAFTKMHGLGNDFIVVDNTDGSLELERSAIQALADRRTGVGFDQLLVVEPPSVEGVEFDYRIYNADGSEVEHCGNGARCFARFVHDRGLTKSQRIPVNTAGGRIELRLLDDGRVTVDMGIPDFEVSSLPFDPVDPALPDLPQAIDDNTWCLSLQGQEYLFGVVSLGNPHITLFVDDVEHAPVEQLGSYLESHPRFASRVNVGFVQVDGRDSAKLRVFERGVGETRACGTGACAAMAIGHQRGKLNSSVQVNLPGGILELNWPGPGSCIEMTGPCSTVFEGRMRM